MMTPAGVISSTDDFDPACAGSVRECHLNMLVLMTGLVALLFGLVSGLVSWILIPRAGGTALQRLTGSATAAALTCGLVISAVAAYKA